MPTTRIKELAWQPRVRDVLSYLFYGFGTSAPSDGEGAGTAHKGSMFVDYVNGVVYYNSGSRTSPTWTPIGGGAPNTKFGDDDYLRFGDGSSASDESVSDTAFYYDSTNQRLVLDVDRPATTSPSYAYGLYLDGGTDGFFAHVGAYKSRMLYLGGTRSTAVAGGDSNDMLVDLSYSNYAANTPAGHYARGISVSLNNRGGGTNCDLQGGFVSVRQRGDGGDIGTIRGLQLDVVTNVGGTAASSAVEGLRVEFQAETDMPSASYGVVVRNRTDGVYTIPTAAVKVLNDGTSACKGWSYGLDLLSSTSVKTVDLGDIRFSQTDGTLPCVLFTGTAANDGDIVTDVGADSLWADGCLYISVVDGAGKLFQKQNDVWVDLQA